MSFETEKTRQHLRDQLVTLGEQERLRAMQALSCNYGTGSKAALATLLRAALGGVDESSEQQSSEQAVLESDANTTARRPFLSGQIAEPMQSSANDPVFGVVEASTGS